MWGCACGCEHLNRLNLLGLAAVMESPSDARIGRWHARLNVHNILTCDKLLLQMRALKRSDTHYKQRNQRLKALRKLNSAFLEAERAYKRAWKAKNRERLRKQGACLESG